MMVFSEIMESANKLTEALAEGTFDKVFHEVMGPELSPLEISCITEVAEVYKQVKDGRISREEGILKQKEIEKEYRKEVILC